MDQLRIIVNQNTFCGTMYQKYFCRDIPPKRGSIQQVNCLNCPVDQYHVVVEIMQVRKTTPRMWTTTTSPLPSGSSG